MGEEREEPPTCSFQFLLYHCDLYLQVWCWIICLPSKSEGKYLHIKWGFHFVRYDRITVKVKMTSKEDLL